MAFESGIQNFKTGARAFGQEVKSVAAFEWNGFKSSLGHLKTSVFGNTDLDNASEAEKAHAAEIVRTLGHVRWKETYSLLGMTLEAGDSFSFDRSAMFDLAGEAIDVAYEKTGGKGWVESRKEDLKTRWASHKAANPEKWYVVAKEMIDGLVEGAKKIWLSKVSVWIQGAVSQFMRFLTVLSGQLVQFFAEFLGKASPALGYVADGFQIVSGLKDIIKNAYYWYKLEKRSVQYKVHNGAPSLILKALERHYATRIGSGSKNAGLGITTVSLRVTLDGGGMGSGAVAGLVIGLLTATAALIDRVAERIFLGCAISAAKEASTTNGTIKTDYAAFCNWFRNWLVVSPVLAALVLHLNYETANAGLFLRHTGATGSEVEDMAKLRTHAKRYLNQHMDEYNLKFRSDDEAVNNKLLMAYT